MWKYYPIDPAKNKDGADPESDYKALYKLAKENISALTLPQTIDVQSEAIALFALDTQVLLDLYKKKNTKAVKRHWDRLKELLRNNKAAWKIIVGHHPVKTHGRHSGFRTGWWWVPPVFLYTIAERIHKSIQDTDHSANQQFQNALKKIMKQDKTVRIYLSGHDHSLQFLTIDVENFQIISGSAAKQTSTTEDEKDTLFSHASYGFVRFDATESEMWIEFFSVNVNSKRYQSSALFKIPN